MASWWHPSSPDERELVRESESFLLGTYVEYLRSQGRWVPPWAWLNTLAHGDPETVRALAADEAVHGPPCAAERVWQQAVAYLAQELALRCEGGSLAGVQRSTLVPLELRLAAIPTSDMDPGDFVCEVMRALGERPARHRP